MSTSNDALQQRREQREAPRRWALEHAEILELIWSRFEANGEWPLAKQLQRELFATGRQFDATAFGFEIPPSLGRLDPSVGKIALTPRALLSVPAARPVLDRMAALVQEGVRRYANASGETEISSGEFGRLLHIDQRRADLLTEVLLQDSWLFRPEGGGAGEPQRFQIDDSAILHVREVEDIEDYLDAQADVWWSVPRGTGIPHPVVEPEEGPPEILPEQLMPVPEPLRGLHPRVLSASARAWANGHRREAIDRAAVTVVHAVQELSGLENLDGHELMAQAFSPNNPRIVVADLRTRIGKDLQRGTHLLAMGAMAGIRNVASHSLKEPSEGDARDQLAVLSLIARRVDEGRGAAPEWRKSA